MAPLSLVPPASPPRGARTHARVHTHLPPPSQHTTYTLCNNANANNKQGGPYADFLTNLCYDHIVEAAARPPPPASRL